MISFDASSISDPDIKNAFICLRAGKFRYAKGHANKALAVNPENAYAYLVLLMVESKAKTFEDLGYRAEPFERSAVYYNIIRFGNSDLTADIKTINDAIKDRNHQTEEKKHNVTTKIKNYILGVFLVVLIAAISAGAITLVMHLLKKSREVPPQDAHLEIYQEGTMFSAGFNYTLALTSDGNVLVSEEVGSPLIPDYGQCNVSGWEDIVFISAAVDHTVGVRSDGTVVATGNSEFGKCDVYNWRDIVAVAVGDEHTIGLKSDGSVVATGNNEHGECDVSGWEDIVAIDTSDNTTVGLKSDGSVVITGYSKQDVSDWEDIVEIAVSSGSVYGLTSVGAVEPYADEFKWNYIVAISAGPEGSLYALRRDGAIIYGVRDKDIYNFGDVVAISSGYTTGELVYMTSDGKVKSMGMGSGYYEGWDLID